MVKTGYKQTEIGVIPEDWEVKELGNILISNPDYGINAAAVKYDDNLPTYLRITDIDDNGNFIKDSLSSVDDVNSHNYFLKEDEIVFARTGASVGKTYLYKKNDGELVFAGFLIRVKINTSEANSEFIFYNTQTKYYQNWILANSMRSGQPGINSNEINSLQIPLPPLAEQEAIAEALSDADAWIESLEQLIAKKRLIKQGAMQELLTPKEDWEVKKLGEIGKTFSGLSGKTKVDFGKGNSFYIPFMNVMKNVVIDNSFFEKVNLKQGEVQNRVLKNDLLFNGSSETPEELGISSVLLEDIDYLYLNSFCFGFRLFDININPLFLSYLFRSPYGREIIFHLAQGATRYNLSKANFLELEISLPQSLSEQTRIASILSDMDVELEALEKQLGKARQIKQGMMQELLTGRKRLEL